MSTYILMTKLSPEVSKKMKDIIKVDLRMVDVSDFLIVYFDEDIPICGTTHEIVLCSQQRKPVLIVSRTGKMKIYDWLFGLLDHEEFFSSFDELEEYLMDIDFGISQISNKWLFFNKEVLIKSVAS